MERRYRSAWKYTSQIVLSILTVKNAVHPDPVEVKLIFRQLVVSVYQQSTKRTCLCVPFVIVISLTSNHKYYEGVFTVQMAVGVSFSIVRLNINVA